MKEWRVTSEPAVELSRWKKEVFTQIEEKIANLELTSTVISSNPSSLQDPHVKQAIQDLRNNFVITPIDKANANVAIICKWFYILTLNKSLG